MELIKQAAYLKGVAEGLGIAGETPTDKLIVKLLDLVSDMADAIEELTKKCDDLEEYADELDADLGDVEDYLFSDDDEDDYEDDEYDEEDDDEYEDDEIYEINCPSCGEVVCFDDSVDPESIICPACGEEFGSICIDCEDCEEGDCENCSKITDDEE